MYRKAPDEAHFTRVTVFGFSFDGTTRVVSDATISKGDYTYFVTGVNGAGDETAATTLPVSGPDRFLHTTAELRPPDDCHASPWRYESVRNLKVTDGRGSYKTSNKNSRLTTIEWSRVPEPQVAGYNIYRMCPFHGNCLNFTDTMEHFACESSWVRLNATLVPPEQRVFQDASPGGLQGCFNYAARPVWPDGTEGPITKMTAADLVVDLVTVATQFKAAGSFAHFTKTPWVSPPACCICLGPNCQNDACHTCQDKVADFILNNPPDTGSNELPGINTITRGTAHPTLPVPSPQGVTQYVMEKHEPQDGYSRAKFARISWAMENPPKNLLGFHVETAGSPNGPWQRLTKHPVAWWERNYIAQGVGVFRCDAYSGHTECLSYRVIAVDEAGNESQPAYATNNPPPGSCPMTPAPPTNLRASATPDPTIPPRDPPRCATLLEWEPSIGATEYYVYRTVVHAQAPYFYDTKRVVTIPGSVLATSYVELGEKTGVGEPPPVGPTCPDLTCGIVTGDPAGSGQCSQGYLAAYYVTARTPNANDAGGESPRSNLVFWDCQGTFGEYAKVLTGDNPTEAIAALKEHLQGEALACWETDASKPVGFDRDGTEPPDRIGPTRSTTEPMLRLGAITDPAWVMYDLHTDHLGSVRAITNSNGTIVSLHNYFPFGEEMTQTPSYNTHQFTGHERDKETGLDYMLARYYEAGVGRFVSADPSSHAVVSTDPQSWNRYEYSLNNPLKYVDLNGKYPTGIHNQIIDRAFPGLSKEQRQVLKTASKSVDADQSTVGSYKHGMRAPGQSIADASKKSGEFIKSNEGKAQEQQKSYESGGGTGLSNASLSSFGNALHTVTDSKSPAHEGFQEWKGTDSMGNKADAVKHYLNEASPSEENLEGAVDAAQKAFEDTYGPDAAKSAIKVSKDDKQK